MKICFYKLLILVIFCSFITNGYSENFQSNRTNDINNTKRNDWYFIEVLNCKFPVPIDFVLQTNAEHYSFIKQRKNILDDNLGKISITDISHLPDNKKDFSISTLDKNKYLTYDLLKYKGKDFAYLIHNNSKLITLYGIDKNTVDYMYNYCNDHRIEDNLDCYTANSKFTCFFHKRNSED